jgi:heme oxygenase
MTPVVGANGLTWRIFIPAVDATEHDVEDQAVIDRAARGTVEVLLKAMGAYRRLDDEYPR